MSTVAVADTGLLIHLTEIDALELLETIDKLLVLNTVYEELPAGGLPTGFASLETVRVPADIQSIGNHQREFDPGETAALAIANIRDAILLTDDLAARDAATSLGVEVHGSIGIIRTKRRIKVTMSKTKSRI